MKSQNHFYYDKNYKIKIKNCTILLSKTVQFFWLDKNLQVNITKVLWGRGSQISADFL